MVLSVRKVLLVQTVLTVQLDPKDLLVP